MLCRSFCRSYKQKKDKVISITKFTLEDLDKSYKYDPTTGYIHSRVTNNRLGSYSCGSVYLSKRIHNTVLQIRAAPLVWLLYHRVFPHIPVRYKDGNYLNLKVDNLYLSWTPRNKKRKRNKVLEVTAEDGVLYNTFRCWFVVRRGKKLPPYTALSLSEATDIRDEWLSDKKLCRWDFHHKTMDYYSKSNYFHTKQCKNLTNRGQYT